MHFTERSPLTQNGFQPLNEVATVSYEDLDPSSLKGQALTEDASAPKSSIPLEAPDKVHEVSPHEGKVSIILKDSKDGEASVALDGFSISTKCSFVAVIKQDQCSSPLLT